MISFFPITYNLRSNRSKTVRKFQAFTLIELLISLSIIGIVAGMSISAYPAFSEQIALSGDTYAMLAYFRETQAYGVSAEATPGVKFVYAFVIDKSNPLIQRVQIQNPSTTDKSNQYYINNSSLDTTAPSSSLKSIFEISDIDGIMHGATTSLDKGYAFFKRPDPEARLVGTVGSNSSIEPSTDTTGFDRIEITIRSRNNHAFTKKLVILSTGQMYVSDW